MRAAFVEEPFLYFVESLTKGPSNHPDFALVMSKIEKWVLLSLWVWRLVYSCGLVGSFSSWLVFQHITRQGPFSFIALLSSPKINWVCQGKTFHLAEWKKKILMLSFYFVELNMIIASDYAYISYFCLKLSEICILNIPDNTDWLKKHLNLKQTSSISGKFSVLFLGIAQKKYVEKKMECKMTIISRK